MLVCVFVYYSPWNVEVGEDLDYKHEFTLTLTINTESTLKINTLSYFQLIPTLILITEQEFQFIPHLRLKLFVSTFYRFFSEIDQY